MKDVTTRSFGLLIAYLLPGLACVVCLSLCLSPFQQLLNSFMTSDSDAGSFFFLLLVSLLLGLVVNAIRWAIYERLFLKNSRLPSDYFEEISKSDRLLAMHTVIDENLRYHQFYGNLSLVVPPLVALLVTGYVLPCQGLCATLKVLLLSLIVEVIVVLTAVESFERYINRSKAIMKGGDQHA